MSKRRDRILRLWTADPRCHWCGKLTVLVFRPHRSRGSTAYRLGIVEGEATIDHLHPRTDPNRRQVNDGTEVTVLACWKCNNERNALYQSQLPVEVHRQRAREGLERKKARKQC
jgi:hypothetical protein